MGNIINKITGKWIMDLPGGDRTIEFNNGPTVPGYYITGSKGVFTDNTVLPSATPLDTGSCANVGLMAFFNTSTSSIGIYSDAAATKTVTILQVSQSSGPIPWSGSVNNAFWAKALLPATTASVSSMFCEL